MDKRAVIFIFYDSKNKKYLVENRTSKQLFAGEKIFPGGKIEDADFSDLEKTLIREIKEEIGVNAIKYTGLKCTVVSEVGYVLYPFLITAWKGKIPGRSIDRHNCVLEWVEVDKFKPNVKSVQKVLKLVNRYVAQCY